MLARRRNRSILEKKFFNGIDPLLPVASVSFRAVSSALLLRRRLARFLECFQFGVYVKTSTHFARAEFGEHRFLDMGIPCVVRSLLRFPRRSSALPL